MCKYKGGVERFLTSPFVVFLQKQNVKPIKDKIMSCVMINNSIPEDMRQYVSYYGTHFNKKLCEFAVSNMKRKDATTGKLKSITPMTMEELKALLDKYKVEIDSNDQYDALFLANMAKADYWGNSIEDDEHLAKYIDDVLCDPDGYEGVVFWRYLADCCGKGRVIYWENML